MKKAAKVCPIHNAKLVRSETRYGSRYGCPIDGCDVMCWGGSTSTPADQATRDARQRAHAAFDEHWKKRDGSNIVLHHGRGPGQRRHYTYTSLARVLGIPMEKCHIGMMSAVDCERVVMACEYGLVIDNIIERDERHAAEDAAMKKAKGD